MKTSFLISFLFLTGCAFSTSNEIKVAEKLIHQFECHNIDSDQLGHNPVTGFHQRSLAVSKDKALEYLASYKAGDTLFEIPLDQVIQQQFITYKSACYYLGGVTNAVENTTEIHKQ